MLNQLDVEPIIRSIASRRVLVVGDVMLDEYLHGEIGRISPEAPVPVLNLLRTESVLGGAANVARNLAALGAQVSILGALGADNAADSVRGQFHLNRIEHAGVLACSHRPTTRKTRLISSEHNQQVFRFDHEVATDLTEAQESSLLAAVSERIPDADALICSDYLKGVLTRRVLREVAALGRKFSVPVITAPKDIDAEKYANASVLFPNFREFGRLVDHRKNGQGEAWIAPAALSLLERHQFDALLITRGKDGMTLFERTPGAPSREDIPAVSQPVFDVTGAGDTSIAMFALSLAGGATRSLAAKLANLAAGIVVGKRGTACVTVHELLERTNGAGETLAANVCVGGEGISRSAQIGEM